MAGFGLVRMTALEKAVTDLYRAPFAEFVATRKRLADQLKANGDKDGASRVAKLPRPPVSAWAVNQLWWKEQSTFEALIAAAARVKQGAREATKEHRELLAQLREAAARLLQAEGNAASETTLRRVTTTLSAVAASGSFSPEPQGALTADRDPPGFEALGAFGLKSEAPPAPRPSANAEATQERARAAEARRKEEEEKARRKGERERLSKALAQAQDLREAQQREAAKLRRELDDKERAVRETRTLIEQLEAELASL